MLTTSYRLAKENNACSESFDKAVLIFGAPEVFGADTPIPLLEILTKMGCEDAIWCLRCVSPGQESERDRIARLFACVCAERVLPIFERARPDDPRPRLAIEAARRYVDGQTNPEELDAAGSAAWTAALDAARAAWTARGSAAWTARGSAAWAARAAAGTARAAWTAAWTAALAAAGSAEMTVQAVILLDLLNGIEPTSHPVDTTSLDKENGDQSHA